MKVLVAGDFCPQDRVAVFFRDKKFNDVLCEVRNFLQGVDYSIVNLECPICYGDENPIIKCGPNLKCTVDSISAIKWCGFKSVTLANNHFFDYGTEGVINTIRECHKQDIETVGGGLNINDASKILYKKIEEATLAIINICEHEFSIANYAMAGANPISPISTYYSIKKARQNADYVLVIVHGGHEHFQLPSLRMQELYRFFVEVGADAVVNHHQHCYSGYEIYKDKPIFYGLGNFLFDGNRAGGKRTWNEGYLVILDFDKSGIKYELIPYTQCLEVPMVVFMQEEEKKAFFESVEVLNHIICHPDELEKAVNDYYDTCSKIEWLNMEPYSSRIFKKLLSWGLAPSFMKGKKLLTVLNRICCESHRDKVIYVLNKKIKK